MPDRIVIAEASRVIGAAAVETFAAHGFDVVALSRCKPHHYIDILLDERMVQRGNLPTLVSIIKIRKAGFEECCDSLRSMLLWLRRMADTALLPGINE
jgi:NAD(P)-dependent dehydrogenase (short-subunit alcohol dehydrogenase family)